MLNNYPNTFTLLQIHIGDGYATTWGNLRKVFYGVTGTPTKVFDGSVRQVGTYTDVNTEYNWIQSAYLSRMTVPTDVTISMKVYKVSANTCRVSATIGIESTGVGKTLRIHMAQVLDYWPSSPTYSRNGFKMAAPYQDITLSPGQTKVVENLMTFDAESWASPGNIVVVVWAQTPNDPWPAEIHNARFKRGPFNWLKGDMNCDGQVSFGDINPFVLALGGEAGYYAVYPGCDWYNADTNNDGSVGFADINPFVALLVGG
jgi:hypothetical protein